MATEVGTYERQVYCDLSNLSSPVCLFCSVTQKRRLWCGGFHSGMWRLEVKSNPNKRTPLIRFSSVLSLPLVMSLPLFLSLSLSFELRMCVRVSSYLIAVCIYTYTYHYTYLSLPTNQFKHNYTNTTEESVRAVLTAGMDSDCGNLLSTDTLLGLLEDKNETKRAEFATLVDVALTRLFTVIFRLVSEVK